MLYVLMHRKDQTNLLKELKIPVFFGIGKYNYYIPLKKILATTALIETKQVVIFENSVHMAFIEEGSRAIDETRVFIDFSYNNYKWKNNLTF